MKKFMAFTAACVMAVSFTGCSKKQKDTGQKTDSNSAQEADITLLSELSVTPDYAREIINGTSNLTAAENMIIDLPDNISEIYTFRTDQVIGSVDMQEYCKEFMELFKYIYPDHELDKNILLYMGGSSQIEYDDNGVLIKDYNKVADNYDKVMNGEEGNAFFLYDESRSYDSQSEWDSPVCLYTANPIGYGGLTISRGKTVEVYGEKLHHPYEDKYEYPRLFSFDPANWSFGFIGSYMPDSTESFKLSDKEIPINEAVAFFEEYVNALPYPKEKNCRTVVKTVDVYRIKDDIYGYYFNTYYKYLGMKFDYLKNGTVFPGDSPEDGNHYSSAWGYSFMVKSDEVDIVDGVWSLLDAKNSTAYKEVYPFKNAVKKISEKLTQEVQFEVQEIELVYVGIYDKDEAGFINIETYGCSFHPEWKLTMSNPNDDLTYVCYVNALDGENFRYYKAKMG